MKKLLPLIMAASIATPSLAETIHVSDLNFEDLKYENFRVDGDQRVEVEFVAPLMEEDEMGRFIWILDLDSREVVWTSKEASLSRDYDSNVLGLYKDKVKLDDGNYGVYYSTFPFGEHRQGLGVDLLIYGLSAFMRDDERLRERHLKEFYVDVRIEDGKMLYKSVNINPFPDTKPVVEHRKVRGSEFDQFGIDLQEDANLSIYTVTEVTSGDEGDVAWLKNLNTGEEIWRTKRRDMERAGGSSKNRQYKETIPLKKGQYVLTYSSDDTHHFNRWNTNPPNDPEAWGISAYVNKDAKVSSFSPQEAMKDMEIFSMTGIGDDEYRHQSISVKEDVKVRVLALGERASRKRMVDYGWIEDNDGEVVWTMDARDSAHAGGASKNRVVDEVISLPKGDYTVFYSSDDSHSAQRWNDDKPGEPSNWGITLFATERGFDKSKVQLTEKTKSNDHLVKITRVRDDEFITETFVLDEDGEVKIYAIGEGMRGDMADYGYIKDTESGRRVWNMFYDETSHAGGARKNRKVEQVIHLKKGKYKVVFKTDGSHSFKDWNDDAPKDAKNYGITVTKVK